MAANSKSTREIANLGKRVVNHFFTRDPAHSAGTRASSFVFVSKDNILYVVLGLCLILGNDLMTWKVFYVVYCVTGIDTFEERTWRAAHNSAYDKNIDDQVRPAIVPDDVIQPLSDKYWAPHPQTGVFGPAVENRPGAGGEREYYSSPANGSGESVLEEKAWFRPTSLEDLEKPLHH
ncbi:hypothetical protein Patl1_24266 [Pistacia atlantica]|uniref:Uncharacterized protein n=1 Tax=Pistacia atlantica TaxID=434234 RepID=A0ACC0ZWR7_9ROSI|nr:hypothetical protein Patl1_24266 [Pistacia atlantica]